MRTVDLHGSKTNPKGEARSLEGFSRGRQRDLNRANQHVTQKLEELCAVLRHSQSL